MEMKGREAELEVFLGDGSTGEEEETGDGVIEGRLEGFEVFGVTEEHEVREGVDGDGGVSVTVEKDDGLLSEVDVMSKVTPR